MRSARRKKLIEGKKKKSRFFGIFTVFLAPIIIAIFIIAFIKLSTNHWNGEDKIGVTYKLADGNVAVIVLDPKLTEVTTLIIPADTQVEVARNYGNLLIKNVWQLSINEKIKGILLTETVTQNFLFPVFLWSDKDAESLSTGNVPLVLHFIFTPDGTNIKFGDRLSIGIFSLKVKSVNRSKIDLGKSQFLTKKKMNDGTLGYTINGPMSPRLTVYFSDNFTARVKINDATGEAGIAQKLGQIVEVIGGKIVSVNKMAEMDSDCTVTGNNPDVVKKIANIFSCKSLKGKSDFDLEISLGQKFAKRF